MTNSEQEIKIKCPHCGWIRSIPAGVIENESMASVVRGLGDHIKAVAEKIRALLADPQMDEANAWVDMPACPHCNKVYRYNARTSEVRK